MKFLSLLRRCLALTSGIVPIAATAAGPIVFNEVLAANQAAVPVGNRFPDYVELINTSPQPVSLEGVTLTDDAVPPVPYTLPAGTVLGPGQRLVIWCDRTPGLGQYQALFGISATGETLRLTGPDGSSWDELAMGLQAVDFSVGRVPEGTGTWQLNTPSAGLANSPQPTGRQSGLAFNEWLAAPATGDDWLEVYNPDVTPVAMGGLIITDRPKPPFTHRPVPALSFIAPRGFIQFFASDLRRLDADHLPFRLSTDGETLSLVAADAVTLLHQTTFGAQSPNTSEGRTPDGGDAITRFPTGQSTPGESNVRLLTNVVISEILSHSDPPYEDAIELQNISSVTVDLSRWGLSDAAGEPFKYRFPAGTQLAPGAFLVVYEVQFGSGPNGFSLNSYEGDEVWLTATAADGQPTGELGFVRFGPLINAVSAGRVATSAGTDFTPLERPTFGVDIPTSLPHFRTGKGATNAGPAVSPVLLSELFFSPSSGATGGTSEPFVELLNPSTDAVPLYDPAHATNAWRLRGNVQFDLPTGIILPPGGRLVIVEFDPAGDPARLERFRADRGIPTGVPILGRFRGNLEDWETGLELQRPDAPEGLDKPRPGLVPYVRAERVDRLATPPWPETSPQDGNSLTRRNPAGFANDPASWQAAVPSPGTESAQPADADQDGMPDAWEREHGLDPGDPADALTDADGDGSVNRDEFHAGTDPRDASSVLRVAAVLRDGSVEISFRAVPGPSYRLEHRLLEETSWSTLTNILPVSEPSTVTVPVPVAIPRLLRVVIPTPP